MKMPTSSCRPAHKGWVGGPAKRIQFLSRIASDLNSSFLDPNGYHLGRIPDSVIAFGRRFVEFPTLSSFWDPDGSITSHCRRLGTQMHPAKKNKNIPAKP